MSWSASTKSFDKNAELTFDKFSCSPADIQGPMLAQMNDAIDATKLLLKTIPGPNVLVTMSGHANGVGWNKKDGWSNDCITITVNQVTK